ncbi:MAG: hypothetical protein Q8L12_02850 [Methylibium sp.]|nr:hypothetical protein [Methylibium sp.]
MKSFLSVTALFLITPAWAGLDESITRLQSEWEQIKYKQPADKHEKAYEALTKDAAAVRVEHPDRSEADIWYAIALASQAGAKGGLGALSLAREARTVLEQSLARNPEALNGSAYVTLSSLYCQVPGWPIGFGDKKKADELMQSALKLNPQGIDPNFFYGEFLLEQKRPADALAYLERALQAPARPGRQIADAGRRDEARELIEKARAQLAR